MYVNFLFDKVPGKSEDMDRVIRELTQAVIKSKNVATITKAMRSRGDRRGSSKKGNSSFKRRGGALRSSVRKDFFDTLNFIIAEIDVGNRLRQQVRALRRSLSRGTQMRQLWERSGMRTNGRKLLRTDDEDSSGKGQEEDHEQETPSQRRRRRKSNQVRVHRHSLQQWLRQFSHVLDDKKKHFQRMKRYFAIIIFIDNKPFFPSQSGCSQRMIFSLKISIINFCVLLLRI